MFRHRTVILFLLLGIASSGHIQPSAAQSSVGTLVGTVNHPLLRRYPAVVYLESLDSTRFTVPKVNPVMDQMNLMFTPHVLPVLKGSTIDFPNSDETRHNVYTSRSSVCQFELGIYEEGIVKHVTCDKTGVITVQCNVHAEMRGFIVVSPTPYFATTQNDGSFEIPAVPPGKYRVKFEHERLGLDPVEVTVVADSATTVVFGKPGRKRR